MDALFFMVTHKGEMNISLPGTVDQEFSYICLRTKMDYLVFV